MAASYRVNGDTFVTEKPRVWITNLGGTEWELAPDGKRVVVLTPVESAGAHTPDHEVVFLLNFFDELRRRVRRRKSGNQMRGFSVIPKPPRSGRKAQP